MTDSSYPGIRVYIEKGSYALYEHRPAAFSNINNDDDAGKHVAICSFLISKAGKITPDAIDCDKKSPFELSGKKAYSVSPFLKLLVREAIK